MPKTKQCRQCGLVVTGKKARRAHEKVCTRERPAPRQHFVLFDVPDRVTSWHLPVFDRPR